MSFFFWYLSKNQSQLLLLMLLVFTQWCLFAVPGFSGFLWGGQTFLDLTCFGWPWQFWLHRACHGFVWLPAPPLPLKVRLSLQREQGSWPAQDSTQVEQWVQRCWGWHWSWSAAAQDSLPCSYSLSCFHTMPMEGGHSAAHSWGARSSVPPSSPYRCYAYWSLRQNM